MIIVIIILVVIIHKLVNNRTDDSYYYYYYDCSEATHMIINTITITITITIIVVIIASAMDVTIITQMWKPNMPVGRTIRARPIRRIYLTIICYSVI